MSTIVANYKDTAEPKKIFGTGIHIAGDKYVTIKADDRSLYGKKVRTKILLAYCTPACLGGYTESCFLDVS